jgi:hypothetical protein
VVAADLTAIRRPALKYANVLAEPVATTRPARFVGIEDRSRLRQIIARMNQGLDVQLVRVPQPDLVVAALVGGSSVSR